MDKSELRRIIIDQNKNIMKDSEELIDRTIFNKIEENIRNKFILILTGIRRSGKSTLLKQSLLKFPGCYFNFDDDRLVNFKLEDFQELYELLIEIYGNDKIFYFDEIQNISGWERFIRRLHDENEKIILTGSNASLLSRELGTHLTGRNISLNLYPFSFKEFLDFKEFKINKAYSTHEKILAKKYSKEYLKKGGLPEYLKTEKVDYLRSLYDNILYKDIIVRYNLSNEKQLKEIVYLAMNSIGKQISFNSIKKTVGLGSSTTVKEYFDYLENSYVLFLVPIFDYSLKKQVFSNKKIYVIDNALAINLGFRFSEDSGRLLENSVFLELKRQKKEIFYFQEKNECDFVTRKGIKVREAIQVCYELNSQNKEREIKGLIEAMNYFKLKEGIIITYDQEEEIKKENKLIKIKPFWKWTLEK